MQFIRWGFWFLVVFSVISCDRGQADILGENSSIALKLHADYTEHEMVLTRAGVDTPAVDSFMVRLENTKAEILKTWKYSELPKLIKVVPGSYKLVAWYGSEEELPMFDRAYYYGERKLTLKEGDNLDTTLIASRAATKVAVTFHESFDTDYSDYFVDIKTEGDSLRFMKEETRAGYFRPGKLRMRLGLKIKGEDLYREFYPPAITSVKGKEFYNFTLKVQTTNGSLSGFIISTDSSTIEIPVNVELPPMYLPKKAPVIKLTGNDVVDGAVETNEGIHKKAMFTASSIAGLTKLKLHTTCPSLIEKGWPTDVDLMKLTEQQKSVLAKYGLEWSEELNTQDTIANMVWVRFDNVVKLMTTPSGLQTKAAFNIVATDRFGQSTDSLLNVTVNPPIFSFVTPATEGDVFARRAIYDIEYQSEVQKPVIEVMQGSSWIPLTTELNDKGSNQYECTGIGLTPNSSCQIRIRLGEHILSAGTYTTEQNLQVPNGNMEEWYLEIKKNMFGQKTYLYRTYAQNERSPWWANNNVRSTWWTVAPVEHNSAPAVSYLSERGGKVAEIRTTGSGSGYANTSLVLYEESIIPGMLFIGDYHYDKPTESITYGKPFASRPAALKFWYHYIPYNNEEFEAYIEIQNRTGKETVVLASGVFTSAVATSDYQQANVELNYKNRKLKATHMYIRFLSSNAAKPKVQKKVSINLENIKSDWGAHVGSRLKIDDIELVY